MKTIDKKYPPQYLPLVPDRFYRKSETIANRYYGIGATQLEKKIAAGEIAPPIKLSPTGRALGWFGRTIIAHQQKVEASS